MKTIIHNAVREWLLWGMDHFPMVLFAVLGGMVKFFIGNESSSFRVFMAGSFTSLFVGLVVLLILDDINGITAGQKAAIIGLSGYSSTAIIGLLSKRLIQRLGGVINDRD